LKRMGTAAGYPVRYKRMIVTLRPGDSIPLF
jgi:ribosomal protein L23